MATPLVRVTMARDLRGDLPQMLVGLPLQKGQGHVLGSVQRRSPILDQGAAGSQQLFQNINGLFFDRCQFRLQACGHPRQHFRFRRVGLDPRVTGLGKALRLQGVDP